ncbi:unnamed protein product [Linum trigynum]|uniref:Uncharacterized protein n=1 Tax=Linum trigynum TaxID=586398 RepID=A0AAV2GT10_9ROSI
MVLVVNVSQIEEMGTTISPPHRLRYSTNQRSTLFCRSDITGGADSSFLPMVLLQDLSQRREGVSVPPPLPPMWNLPKPTTPNHYLVTVPTSTADTDDALSPPAASTFQISRIQSSELCPFNGDSQKSEEQSARSLPHQIPVDKLGQQR